MKFLRRKNDTLDKQEFYIPADKVRGPKSLFKSRQPELVIFDGGPGSYAIAIVEFDFDSEVQLPASYSGVAHFRLGKNLFGYGFRWNGQEGQDKDGNEFAGFPAAGRKDPEVQNAAKWVALPEAIVNQMGLQLHEKLLRDKLAVQPCVVE